MESRSPSSSPDPLEYPGDPKFLLSSATKSIPRRISFSPRKSQSPQRRSQATDRNSSIKPLKFSDVVLPSTPSGGRRGRDSLSPSKATMQSEGNVSPWRIRVTVEAEREDEEGDAAGGAQNAISTWKDATTTKVPLKGGASSTEPTPKKRRKTPKKSAVSERVPTPRRRKSQQSAGDDGDPGATPKRGRGRPRKSLQSIDGNKDLPRTSPAPTPVAEFPQNEDPFLDLAMDKDVTVGSLDKRLDSGAPDHVVNAAMSDQSNFGRVSPKPGTQGDENYQQDNEGKISTLQASPIPNRGDGSSPGNTLHAGHTPRPRSRLYPTPTSSSLIEGDGAETKTSASLKKGRPPPHPRTRMLQDPTGEHREFDSIMESEEFSMVSLDTLPSAKQQLSGAAKAGLNAASGTLSSSQQNLHDSPKTEKQFAASHQAMSESAQAHTYPVIGDISYPIIQTADKNSSPDETRVEHEISPQQPPPTALDPRQKPLARLVRVIRAGIALQGLFNHNNSNGYRIQTQSSSPDRNYESEAFKQRLDNLFRGLDVENERVLNAGLRFGGELARTQKSNEEQQIAHQLGPPDVNMVDNMPDNDSITSSEIGPPPKITNPLDHSPGQPSPISGNNLGYTDEEKMEVEMARREAEWQREREAISRQIQAANSSQVIVIDDRDENGTSQAPSGSDRGMRGSREVFYQEEEAPEDHDEGHEGDEAEMYENDDYEDIWQQEAQHFTEPSVEGSIPPLPARLPRWQIEEYVEHGRPGPPSELSVLSAGRTQMARYRNGDFEFSSLVGTPESATRRFYQDDMVSPYNPPHDNLQSARSQQRPKSTPETVVSYPEFSRTPRPNPQLAAPNTPPSEYLHSEHSADGEHDFNVDEKYLHMEDEQAAINSHADQVQYPDERSSPPVRWSSPDRSSDGMTEDHAHPDDDPSQEVHASTILNMAPNGRDARAAPQARPQEREEQTVSSSWFNKLAELAPSWLTSKVGQESAKAVEVQQPVQAQNNVNGIFPQQVVDHSAQASFPPPPNSKPEPPPRKRRKASPPQKALALGGYFTDDHYVALSRLYRKAKKHPDHFVYESTPEREKIVGRWLWTEDGQHPRQITEIQIAIADRFRKDLVDASRRRGGSDQLGFSELDILWRLWSIIVGEKIRRERKLANQVGNS